MSDKDTLVFVGQKAFINKNDKVLVLKDPNYAIGGQVGLDFPGGRFRWGADPEEELLREVDEETGLKIKIGKPFVTWTNQNHKTKGAKTIFLVGYLCEYVGGEVKLSEEHEDFEWVDEKSYKNWTEDNDYFKALERYFEIIRALSSAG